MWTSIEYHRLHLSLAGSLILLIGHCYTLQTLDEVKRLPLPNGPPQRACLAVARFAYYYGYLIGGVTNCKGIYLYSDDMLINNYTTGTVFPGHEVAMEIDNLVNNIFSMFTTSISNIFHFCRAIRLASEVLLFNHLCSAPFHDRLRQCMLDFEHDIL